MTKKFIGEFVFDSAKSSDDALAGLELKTSEQPLPCKQEWHAYSIYEFNGKIYRPVTSKAARNLEDVVKSMMALGFSKAVKDCKRKPSSLKYAI